MAVSLTAGVAATAALASGATEVVENDVEIKTPDGTCDAAFIHPKTGSYPGVLIWPDAFGLRPAMLDIGKRLAADGYSVLVPNPFYRVSKAPFTDASHFDFQNSADMAKIRPLMASVNAPGAAEKDAVAYVTFLDAQKEVNKAKRSEPRVTVWRADDGLPGSYSSNLAWRMAAVPQSGPEVRFESIISSRLPGIRHPAWDQATTCVPKCYATTQDVCVMARGAKDDTPLPTRIEVRQ